MDQENEHWSFILPTYTLLVSIGVEYMCCDVHPLFHVFFSVARATVTISFPFYNSNHLTWMCLLHISVSNLKRTRHKMLRRWRSSTTYSLPWWLVVPMVFSSIHKSHIRFRFCFQKFHGYTSLHENFHIWFSRCRWALYRYQNVILEHRFSQNVRFPISFTGNFNLSYSLLIWFCSGCSGSCGQRSDGSTGHEERKRKKAIVPSADRHE